ncbi:hypothetical protein EBN03_28015 [Nocardia stercoris]|uniref:Uncharacterized protein n=1 Tax=Nocardia stercoris TaxID=2483361 RepID=A0A3M2KXM8_9NOCA|nr:hypothetical protein EBN03_28015 [Nocardia stercoris]
MAIATIGKQAKNPVRSNAGESVQAVGKGTRNRSHQYTVVTMAVSKVYLGTEWLWRTVHRASVTRRRSASQRTAAKVTNVVVMKTGPNHPKAEMPPSRTASSTSLVDSTKLRNSPPATRRATCSMSDDGLDLGRLPSSSSALRTRCRW